MRYHAWIDQIVLEDVVREIELSEEAGNDTALKASLTAFANLHAGYPSVVYETTERLARMTSHDEVPQSTRVAEPRALDAFVRGDRASAEALHAYVAAITVQRDAVWIPTEILLEDMGFPVPPNPNRPQWLEPYDVVQARWLGHARRIRGYVA